jgi:hypothetical protein
MILSTWQRGGHVHTIEQTVTLARRRRRRYSGRRCGCMSAAGHVDGRCSPVAWSERELAAALGLRQRERDLGFTPYRCATSGTEAP